MIEAREKYLYTLFLLQYILALFSWISSQRPPVRGSQKGGFSVYVGPQRERFVVRTEWANHALFRDLLDRAETEYGFDMAGPLELPCDVGLFQWVVMEIMSQELDVGSPRCSDFARSPLRGFGRGHAGYKLINPA